MKMKIILDTEQDVIDIVTIASSFPEEKMVLTDNNSFAVNAKSILGAAYAKFEFNEIWLETEKEHYFEFKEFAAE